MTGSKRKMNKIIAMPIGGAQSTIYRSINECAKDLDLSWHLLDYAINAGVAYKGYFFDYALEVNYGKNSVIS